MCYIRTGWIMLFVAYLAHPRMVRVDAVQLILVASNAQHPARVPSIPTQIGGTSTVVSVRGGYW